MLCITGGIYKLISRTVPIIDFYDSYEVLYWFNINRFFKFSYVLFKLTYVVIFHMIARIIMAIDEPTPLMCGPWIAVLVFNMTVTDTI